MAADPGARPLWGHDHDHGLAGATAAIAARDRRRRLRRGLTISLFTVVALALGLEAWFRLTGDRLRAFEAGFNRTDRRWAMLSRARILEEVDDPQRRYALRPGASTVVDGMLFRVSSQGTRGPEIPQHKPPNERRLLAVGDSFCFGEWCAEDETLVGHLVAMANERERAAGSGIHWRAVNIGVPGYHSRQQLIAFEEEGLAFDPDAVVLYYNTNDLERPGLFYNGELGALYVDYLPLPIALKRWLWETSHLYGFLARKYATSFEDIPYHSLNPDVPYAWNRPANMEDTRRAITRIAEICRERELPLFFVNQPLMTWSAIARDPDWPVLPLVRWGTELREELRLPGISLLGWMRGYADGVDRYPAPRDEGFSMERYLSADAVQAFFRGETVVPEESPDLHLIGEGYRLVARICYPRMQEAGILP